MVARDITVHDRVNKSVGPHWKLGIGTTMKEMDFLTKMACSTDCINRSYRLLVTPNKWRFLIPMSKCTTSKPFSYLGRSGNLIEIGRTKWLLGRPCDDWKRRKMSQLPKTKQEENRRSTICNPSKRVVGSMLVLYNILDNMNLTFHDHLSFC